MVTVVLLPGHGYIPLLVVDTTFVNFWAGVKVSKARKKYNILYSQFDNLIEDSVFAGVNPIPLRLIGPFRPGVVAITGAIHVAGFIFFVRGYVTGDPKKCMRGRFGFVGKLVAIGLSIESGLRIAGAI